MTKKEKTMTKKDYEIIADCISACAVDKEGKISKAALIGYFRRAPAGNNGLFNTSKFDKACGV